MIGFNEKEFNATLGQLTRSGQLEEALTYLIDHLPVLEKSKTNRKEKLKHLLFAAREIQAGGIAKHGWVRLLENTRLLKSCLLKHRLKNRNVFVDFGCGVHDPIALASYFYLNGFQTSFAIEQNPTRDPHYSALSMYDILANMNLFPDRYLLEGTSEKEFKKRLHNFDVMAFEKSDFEGGLAKVAENVIHEVGDIAESSIPFGQVSLLYSFTVFEHVMDVPGVLALMYEMMEPGGLAFHFIDLADHRVYRPDDVYNEFSFLTDEVAPPNMNRMRKSEFLSAFKQAGFTMVEIKVLTKQVPEETLQAFQPRWAKMSREDQETYGLYVTVRKPE